MRRTLPLTVVLLAWLAWAPAAQQTGQTPPAAPQPPQGLTFRATANYVEVDALVTGSDGDPVKDLKASDFDVAEDGKPQALSVCAFVDIPIDRPDPLLVREKGPEPDVFTNEKSFDGRVFMFVLDGYHVATARSIQVRKQARLFIEKYLGENDLAAVIHIGAPTYGQEFTSNKRLLLGSVDRFSGAALLSPTKATIQDALAKELATASGITTGPPTDMEAASRSFMAKESLDSLTRLSEYMATLSGRKKAVLFFSEGIDYDMRDAPVDQRSGTLLLVRDASAVRTAQDAMLASATAANVSIYSIDPRGATNGLEEAVGKLPLVEGPYGFLARDYPTMANDDLNRAHDSLRLLADQTGGRAVLNQNDMDSAFRRVLDDNSAYYILGYTSPAAKRDGKYHRVSVKVRRAGLLVRTKNGYHAASDKGAPPKRPLDAINETLANPAAVTGLGMRLSAGVIKGLMLKSTVHLTLELSGKDLALQSSGGLFVNDVEIKYLVVDMTGQQQAARREIAHLALKPATKEVFPIYGMRWVTEFELAPGHYQLRVAARDKVTGKVGSLFTDLEVPDLARLPLGMSDLLITSTTATKAAMGPSPSTLGTILPTPTTTFREFSAADTITALAAFYDNATALHRVDLKATVTGDTGAQVFLKEDVRDSKELDPAKGGYRWTVAVPLKGLAPGRYLLSIEGRSRLGDSATVKKETEFKIK